MLSANAEYPVKAEQLHDETDLNTKITRCSTILKYDMMYSFVLTVIFYCRTTSFFLFHFTSLHLSNLFL